MIPTHRTRSRSELCPSRQEPAINARIIEGNVCAIEDYLNACGPRHANHFDDGTVKVEAYMARLVVNVRNGSVSFDTRQAGAENPNFTISILDITLVDVEDEERTVTCRVHQAGRDMSERAAANFQASVQAIEEQ